MVNKIIIIMLAVLTVGCSYDNMIYKYGNGVKSAISGASSAIACVAVAPVVCASAAGLKGYIDGKQAAREKIVAKDNAKLIKKLADEKARDKGVKVDNCWFWNC